MHYKIEITDMEDKLTDKELDLRTIAPEAYVGLVVIVGLDGVENPIEDIFYARATCIRDAINAVREQYVHKRRIPHTQVMVKQLLTFAEFVKTKGCFAEDKPLEEVVKKAEPILADAVQSKRRRRSRQQSKEPEAAKSAAQTRLDKRYGEKLEQGATDQSEATTDKPKSRRRRRS